MSRFLKQFVFISTIIGILMIGGLVIYSATPGGKVKINPILGHDLDLNALYYAQAANNTVHDITTQDISISAWVKVDVDAGDYGMLFAKRKTGTGYNGYNFDYSNSGKVQIYIQDGNDSYAVTGNTDIRDNKWHYISAIIDRDTAGNCKVFLDGVDNTATRTGTITNVDSLSWTGILQLGRWEDGRYPFDGQIRDVKLYYAAGDHWSDAQVLYQAQHPFDYTANAGTLTDYWRLDEGTGTTLYGYANNLTLSNALAWTTQPKIKMVKQENSTTTSNNPVGWWKFDETTAIHGSTLADSSGNGNTGTLSTGDGATNKSVAGKLGRGVQFDGVNDYVSVASSSALNITGAITVSAWAKINSQINYASIVMKGYAGLSTATGGYVIRLNPNGKILFRIAGTSATYEAESATTTFSVWHHIVGVYNQTNVLIYVDGVQVVGNAYSGNIVATTTYNVEIGRDAYTTGGLRYFNGSIDDVRIFNRALTAGEVSQMYNSTKDGYLGNIKVSTGLVGYWKLDDNNALTSVTDYSGKGNTGTAYSGTATTTSVLSTSTAMIGRAMSFDGVNDYISVGDNTAFNSDSITVSTWVYVNDWSMVDTNRAILQYRYPDATPSGYYLALIASNGFAFNTYNGVGSAKDAVSTGYATSTWYHIVGTYNFSTSQVKLYVNGVLKDTDTMTGPIVYNDYPANLQLQMGRDYGGGVGRYFNGLIDEVKIWNYARTPKQIWNDYQKGLANLQ